MINPININKINIQGIQAKKQTTDKTAQASNTLELSGYKTGQAILARNNIAFRNLAQPIEVTDKYNEKVEGNDHLDLPNIHVYEYPDTNLKLVLNLADKINYPLVRISLNDNKHTEYNPIISNLLKIILNRQLLQNFDTDTYFENEGNIISYFQLNNQNSFDNISQLNKSVFNINFDEEELENAKKELIKQVNSDEYKNKNADLKYYYKADDLTTNEDLTKDINSATIHDVKKYYDNYLNNAEGTAWAVISQETFKKDKENIFKAINENIPIKLKKESDTLKTDTFVPNSNLNYIKGLPDFYPLNFNYKVSYNNTKESLVGEIAELILTGDKYTVSEKYYNDPIGIKNPKQISTCLYFKVNVDINNNQNINEDEEYQKFQVYAEKLYQSDFSEELKKYKKLLKEDYKYDLLENENSLERNVPFSIDEYFQIYKLIDSITEEDIKKFLNKFIIEQKPIIHINDTEKYKEDNCQ